MDSTIYEITTDDTGHFMVRMPGWELRDETQNDKFEKLLYLFIEDFSMNAKSELQVWDLWYPQAGATGISFAPSRIQITNIP